MFLDEELLIMCKNADCSTIENIQKLNLDLCTKCESYYKSRMNPNMSMRELKALLDKTFNLWDSFTRMAIKEGGMMKLMGTLFQSQSFKKQWLSNPEIARIYNNLKP